MFTPLHRWEIEVDQDRQQPNLAAQQDFIRDFGRMLYQAVDQADGPLHPLRYVYFTRIFYPDRDHMGAYVRLHFYVDGQYEEAAVTELDRRLEDYKEMGKVFQIKKETIDGNNEARLKGAESFPELYYGYMESLSRTAVQLFQRNLAGTDMDTLLWAWTHNLFNLLRGYQVSILEFPPDVPVRTWRV